MAAPKDLLDYQVKFWINIWTEGGNLKKFEWPKEQECNEELVPITEGDVLAFLHKNFGQPGRVAPKALQLAWRKAQG